MTTIYVDGLHDLDGAHLKASLPLGDALECYASVGNLADEDYEQKLGYPREGRAVRVGLRFDL